MHSGHGDSLDTFSCMLITACVGKELVLGSTVSSCTLRTGFLVLISHSTRCCHASSASCRLSCPTCVFRLATFLVLYDSKDLPAWGFLYLRESHSPPIKRCTGFPAPRLSLYKRMNRMQSSRATRSTQCSKDVTKNREIVVPGRLNAWARSSVCRHQRPGT